MPDANESQSDSETNIVKDSRAQASPLPSSEEGREENVSVGGQPTGTPVRPIPQDRNSPGRSKSVRMFCFSCNRYEGHMIAARNRFLYSFVLGFTFGLYYYLGRYACNCCASRRLCRYDWLNARFWARAMRYGSSAAGSTAKKKRR